MFQLIVNLNSSKRIITTQNYTQAKALVDLYSGLGYAVVLKENK